SAGAAKSTNTRVIERARAKGPRILPGTGGLPFIKVLLGLPGLRSGAPPHPRPDGPNLASDRPLGRIRLMSPENSPRRPIAFAAMPTYSGSCRGDLSGGAIT